MEPLVSVIIPNYNYAHYLREAIDSVLDQTYTNLEVIVVDDGSTDGSREVIESYGDRIEALFQENQGVAVARNRGVAESSGVYIAFLDADDIWLREKVESQMTLFSADDSLGLVHVAVQDINADGNDLNAHFDGLSGDVANEFLLFERGVILGGGSGVLIKRQVFERVGGFDIEMSTSADWDLYYRISAVSEIGFVPSILLKYRIHGSNMHGNIGAMELDMMRGYQKAFAGGTKANSRVCYSNLHKVLAGSYFQAGQYMNFFRHAFNCLWLKPSNFGYFAGFPRRRVRRST